MLDVNGIRVRPRYIRFAANILADSLSRELDSVDWLLIPRNFHYLQSAWGPYSIYRFASMESAPLCGKYHASTQSSVTPNAKKSTA
jgi:hypothetical protein